jgi:glycosyltransferase involved in cell wall biosynthesis
MTRIYAVVTHPIQYNSPFFDAINMDPDLDFCALYLSSFGLNESFDPGFKERIRFDVPLVDNHQHEILKNPFPQKMRRSLFRFFNPKLWKIILNEDAIFIFYGWNNFSAIIGILICYTRSRRFYLRSDGNLLRGKSHRSWRQNFIHNLRVLFLNRILNKANGALFIGTQNRIYYEQMGFQDSKLKFVPFAIDSLRFSGSIDEGVYSGFMSSNRFIRMDLPICIYVGKLIPIKDVDILLQAALQFRGVCNFLIVGSGPEAENLMQKYINIENIHFEGFVNQSLLPTFYKMSVISCLPSKQDSWGLSINEAIACGLVPIVSDSVGCASDLVATTSGLVFETGNLPDLCAKITLALQLCTDKNVTRKIEQISAQFSMHSSVQMLKLGLGLN